MTMPLPPTATPTATPTGPTIPPGSSSAEALLHTPDNLDYDFQAAGEFILLQSTVDDLEVQVRQEPWKDSTFVSINTAVAMDVAGDRVGVYVGEEPALHVNGTPTALADEALPLPGGGLVGRQVEGQITRYAIAWPDQTVVEGYLHAVDVPFLDVVVHLAPARRGQIAGLLGNADGDQSNDLATRDGVVVDLAGLAEDAAHARLYREFGDSWRISQAESLFDYGPGEDTLTYARPDFPSARIAASDLPAPVRSVAEAVCRQAGVVEAGMLADCILDVGLTGEPAFAAGAAAVAVALAPVVAPVGAGLFRTDSPAPTALTGLCWVVGPPCPLDATEWEVRAFRAEVHLDPITNLVTGGAVAFELFNQTALDRGDEDWYRFTYDASDVAPVAPNETRWFGSIGLLVFEGTNAFYYAPPYDPEDPTTISSAAFFLFAFDDAGRLVICQLFDFYTGGDPGRLRQQCLAEPIAVLEPVSETPA
jgi:hypothetical protein